jgi:hypothetical protein
LDDQNYNIELLACARHGAALNQTFCDIEFMFMTVSKPSVMDGVESCTVARFPRVPTSASARRSAQISIAWQSR